MATNQIKLVINATDNSSTALKALANNINNIKGGLASLGSDTATATSGMSKLTSAAQKTPGLFSRIASGAKSALAVFGGYKLISGVFNQISSAMGGAIDRLDTMDLFERKMNILTGDASKASYALNEMKDATKGTAYGLGTAAKAVQNFVTRGMSTEDATKSIRTWMDAVAVYGNGTNEALESVVNALGKMRSKGTVEMRHINTMINAGINPVQLYANATGQAAAQVQEQLSAKNLRTDEFLATVENALRTGANGVAKVTGLAKDMATTWKATFDNMRFALNRGWASMIDGLDSFMGAFGGSGFKGVFKNFGVTAENIMSGIGNAIQHAGWTMTNFYKEFQQSHAGTIQANTDQIEKYQKSIENFTNKAKESLRNNFLQALSPFANDIALKFGQIQVSWNRFKEAVAKGVAQISPQLGQLFGKIFGQGVTNATDLMNAFLNWATIKIPYFFDWLQQKLQWIIDNWELVTQAASYMLKGFIAWKVVGGITGDILKLVTAVGLLKDKISNLKGSGTNVISKIFGGDSAKALGAIENSLTHLKLPKVNPNSIASPEIMSKLSMPEPTMYQNLQKGLTLDMSKGPLLQNILDKDTATASVTWFEKLTSASLDAKNAVGSNLGSIKSFIANSYGESQTIIGRFAEYVWNSFKTMLSGIREFAVEGGSLLLDKFGKGISGLGGGVRSAAEGIGSVAQGFAQLGAGNTEFSGNLFGPMINGIKVLARELPGVTKDFFTTMADGFFQLGGSSLSEFVSNFINNVGLAFNTGKEVFTGFFRTVAEGFFELGGTTLEAFSGKITGFFTGLKDVVLDFFPTLFNGFQELGSSNTMFSGLEGFTKLGANLFPGFEEGFFTEIINGISGIVETFGSLAVAAVNVTMNVANIAAILGMFNPGGAVSDAINSFFDDFGAKAMRFGDNAKDMIIQMGQKFIEELPTLVSQGVELALALARGLLTGIPNVLAAGVQIVSGLITSFLQQAPTLVYQGFTAIGQFIAGLISALPDILAAGWNLITSLVGAIVTNLPLIITTGVQLIWSLITGIASMVGQIGQALWDLIVGGIEWCFNGGLQSAWNNFASTMMGWFRDALNNIGMGWLADTILGAEDQTNEAASYLGRTAGEENIRAAQDAARSGNITPDLVNNYLQGEPEVDEAATQAGTSSGASFVQGASDALAQADVDTDLISDDAAANMESAMTMGTDTGTTFAQSTAEGITAGTPGVQAAASNVSSALTLTFDNATVQQQATDFINTIAIVFTEQAPILYQTTGNIGIGAVNEFVAKVNENLALAYATAVGLMSQFKMGIDDSFNSVREAMNAGINTILTNFGGLNETFYTYGSGAVTRYANGFTDATPSAVAAADGVKVQALEALRGMIDQAYSIGSETINNLHNGITANQSMITSAFDTMMNTVMTTINENLIQVSTAMTDTATTMMERFLVEVDQGFGNVISSVATNRENIYMEAHKLVDYFGQIGDDMMSSLASSIEDKTKTVTDKTNELVEKIKETFETGLGIHSPSRYMQWVGEMMAAGLIGGFSQDQMKTFAESVIGDMQASFEGGNFNATETMDYLDQQNALNLIAKVTGMDLSAVENAQATIPGIIQAAQKEVGYKSPGGRSGSKYGLKYGNNSDWCVSFVRAMAEEAGVPFPQTNYVPDVVSWAQSQGRWTSTPQAGYAGIYYGHGHIELVKSVDAQGNVTTIGGNTGNPRGVYEQKRSGASGYVALDGGHGVGNTLQAVLQQAYDAKYNPAALGGFTGGVAGGQLVDLGGPIAYPLGTRGTVTSGYGFRIHPIFGTGHGHSGIDLAAPMGTPIYSASDGTVSVAQGGYGGYGNAVVVDSGGMSIVYGHMSRIAASVGQHASRGQLIGYVGSTGWSTGPHLHFEMRSAGGGTIDPTDYLMATGQFRVGSRYIPYDMPAIVHQGEAIIPANQNPYTNSGGDYMRDLVMGMWEASSNPYGNVQSNFGQQGTSVNQTMTFNNNITVNVDGDADSTEIADNIAAELHRALVDAIAVGNPR